MTRPLERLGKLKWWFVVIIVLGILALIWVWLSRGEEVYEEFQKLSGFSSPVLVAYNQSIMPLEENVSFHAMPPEEDVSFRAFIIPGIFAILGIVYLAGIFKLFFSNNSEGVETAADLVKTLTGFFVGAGTGFLGA